MGMEYLATCLIKINQIYGNIPFGPYILRVSSNFVRFQGCILRNTWGAMNGANGEDDDSKWVPRWWNFKYVLDFSPRKRVKKITIPCWRSHIFQFFRLVKSHHLLGIPHTMQWVPGFVSCYFSGFSQMPPQKNSSLLEVWTWNPFGDGKFPAELWRGRKSSKAFLRVKGG